MLAKFLPTSARGSLVDDYNRGIMPRVGEFCASNVARLLLGVVIVLVLVAALGEWLYHSPGRATPIEHPASPAEPVK
jgi:hypothetical protein